jgi:hypothetical protein
MLNFPSFRNASVFCAAAAVTSILSFGAASAASVFSISGGGTPGVLPVKFDASGSLTADGIVAGTGVTIFGGAGNLGGLLASPQNVFISFEFMGKEAGYINTVNLVLGNTFLFDNNVAEGTTTAALPFNVGAPPGAVPFYYQAGDGSGTTATNGGAINGELNIAIRLSADQTVAWVFFDDGGGGNPADADYDDMSLKLRISCSPNGGECAPPVATPLPAALPLFAGGLGVIGLVARRRKRKAAEASA